MSLEVGYAVRALGPHQRPDIALRTGTIVRHFPMCNGATQAVNYDLDWREKALTEPEWAEYCLLLRSLP